MGRRESREAAVNIIFQYGFMQEVPAAGSEAADEILRIYQESYEGDGSELDGPYICDVIQGVFSNRAVIDRKINENAKDWDLERMAKYDVAVLRVAVSEMLFRTDIPASVSINEAVELAKRYSHEDAGGFVNGILGSIYGKCSVL